MYAKVFAQIFDSSIAENYLTRLVFTDLLILSDINGVVDMTHEAIARRTNVPIETVRTAISELEQPDPRSRTREAEGRRLTRLDDHRDWGWMIVNYERFRQIASEEQRRAMTKQRVDKHRSLIQKAVTPCNAPVTLGNACNAMEREREKKMEKQKKKDKKKEPESDAPLLNELPPELNNEAFKKIWEDWKAFRKAKRSPLTPISIEKQLAMLSGLGTELAIKSINNSIMNGYAGLFEPKQQHHETNQRPSTRSHERNHTDADWGEPLP